MTLELKRKKQLPMDMCAAKACRKTTGLTNHNFEGKHIVLCSKHSEGIPLHDTPTLEVVLADDSGDDNEEYRDELPEAPQGGYVAAAKARSAALASPVKKGQEDATKTHAVEEHNKAMVISEKIQGMTFANTTEGMNYASQVLHALITARDELDSKRTSATKPLNEALREINSWFKPALDAYENAVSTVRTRIIMARGQIREGVETALTQLQAAYESNDEEAVAVALARHNMLAPVADDIQGLTFSEHWGWEIEDFEIVPRQYLMVNSPLLKAEIKASKGNTSIPGVRVFPFPRVSRKAVK